VTAASARTPPTRPLSTTALLVFASTAAAAAEGTYIGDVGEVLRPNSQCTTRSHLRLSSRSSDSCIVS